MLDALTRLVLSAMAMTTHLQALICHLCVLALGYIGAVNDQSSTIEAN
jgi:hypothetical protein